MTDVTLTPFMRFLQQVAPRPLPPDPLARLRVLARELAEGALVGLWSVDAVYWNGHIGLHMGVQIEEDEQAAITAQFGVSGWQHARAGSVYQRVRWGELSPNPMLLVSLGFLDLVREQTFALKRPAFDLIQEPTALDIFISYRRRESSAFALLVLARLKAAGLNPFLDMTIQPGVDWQDHLRDEIRKRQFVVALIGNETLMSDVVHQELTWALEAGKTIIPVWHNGFVFRAEAWGDGALPPAVREMLATTHTIRVLEESALGYNNALVELLNRFGVTPE